MVKKDTPVRRILSVALIIAGSVAVFSLADNSGANNEVIEVAKGSPRSAEMLSVADIAEVISPGDASVHRLVARDTSLPVYRFETPFVAGKPAAIAARFATPSAAEATMRSARLAELLDGSLSSLRQGDTVQLPLPDNRMVSGRINVVQREADGQIVVGGDLTGEVKGTFSLGEDESRLGGVILPTEGNMGYQIETGRDGAAYLLEKNKGSIVCVELPVMIVSRAIVRDAQRGEIADGDAASSASLVIGEAPMPEYLLSSRPTATAVAYLDFDGETVTDSYWYSGKTINAAAAGFSATQITDVWRRVAEDFRPFNIDVTTDRARYDNASAGSRMRCIITQTSSWYGSAGGVAYIGSWSSSGSGSVSGTIPCWVFANMLSNNPRYVAEAVSHEIGHTLGLSHDGLKGPTGGLISGYYAGHGTGETSWAPIMGSGYYKSVVQWSNGNYGTSGNLGNNTEDDLAIISDARNRSGYAPDDAGDTRELAAALAHEGTVIAMRGFIERTGDVDVYVFTTSGGSLTFSVVPEFSGLAGHANLDARATLYDPSGNVLADSNPVGSLYPSIALSLPAGTYHLAVAGTGEGIVPGTGYTGYGSLGRYEIKGSGALTSPVSTVIVDAEDASGVAISGAWNRSTYFSGYNGNGYLADVGAGERSGKWVQFTPSLPVSTAYDVYLRWTAAPDRADNVPVDVVHAGGTTTLMVNQRVAHGTWVFLGTYGFNAGAGSRVTVRNDGANGVVIVDAAKFEKADASLMPVSQVAISDAADGSGISKSGWWASSTYERGYHGRDYLTDGNTGKSVVKNVRFSPGLPVSGVYAVYARWTTGANRATNVPVDIAAADGTTRKWVNQQADNGIWYHLGAYTFAAGSSGSVTIGNEGANGFVVADAVKFERIP
jgi:hypothetical protein